MPFTMPTKRAIAHYDHTRNAEQRTTNATNAYNRFDSSVGKMYPERSSLPQGVKDAIKRQDGVTY